MKKLTFSLVLIAILIAGYVYFQYGDIYLGGGRVGPNYLYPDKDLTPGLAETADYNDLIREYNGKSFSQFFRQVSQKQKQQVCKNYPNNCKGTFEYDHWVPLCLGGSNDTRNLYPQPENVIWGNKRYGFREKDRLESYLCQKMRGKKITPKEAQDLIQKDWIKAYRKLIEGKEDRFGTLENFDDGEDEVVDLD